MTPMRRLTTLTVATCWLVGCTSQDSQQGNRRLPFVVKLLLEIKTPEEESERAIPPDFPEPEDLLEQVKSALEDAGIFTQVVTETLPGADHDLEMEVTITGTDFGTGQALVGGGIFSTAAWTLTGHLSWLIDDREYPRSDVQMQFLLRDARDLDVEILKRTPPITGLSLSLSERIGGSSYFTSIFVPPCWEEGDRKAVGRSLVERGLEQFLQQVPTRIAADFATSDLDKRSCFLIYRPDDEDNDKLVIVSLDNIRRIKIEKRVFDQEEVHIAKSEAEKAKDEVKRQILRIEPGILLNDSHDLYQVELEPGEHDLIRVSATLDQGCPPCLAAISRARSMSLSTTATSSHPSSSP